MGMAFRETLCYKVVMPAGGTPPYPWKLTDKDGRVIILTGHPDYGQPLIDDKSSPPQIVMGPELLKELWEAANRATS
jgi:hypothetical protein